MQLTDPLPVSEDFGLFGQEWKVPSLFWYVGGTDPGVYARAKQAGASRMIGNKNQICIVHSDVRTSPKNGAEIGGSSKNAENITTSMRRSASAGHNV